ncbi:hypothetical protein LCGC14_0805750 [marine sediment metagenome]|uniref:Uncharacterized protein n=1 Tax=marine sediment metagenome TaxID=412755 RepID=A0A0F9S8A2_9ZZZZ
MSRLGEVIRARESKEDYIKMVRPFLKRFSFSDELLGSLFPRVQWNCNFRTFTIKLEDQNSDYVPDIEGMIRRIWEGSKENRFILHSYLRYKNGPVISFGIIEAQILAQLMKDKMFVKERTNRLENVLFGFIPFAQAYEFCKQYKQAGSCIYWDGIILRS